MARPAGSITRIISLLNFLADHPAEFVTLSEIARRLSLNKATVHAILTALTDAGYLVRHPRDNGYSLGPAIIRVGRAALGREYDAVALARGEMRKLAAAVGGQCVASAARDDQFIVIAATGRPAGTPSAHVGQRGPRLPPYGLLFTAWAAEDQVDAFLDAEPLADAEKQRYRDLLAVVRARGFSVDTQVPERDRLEAAVAILVHDIVNPDARRLLRTVMAEHAHERTELTDIVADRSYKLRNISAPVFGPDGEVLIALVLTGLPVLTGAEVRDHGAALRAATARVSELVADEWKATTADAPTLSGTGSR